MLSISTVSGGGEGMKLVCLRGQSDREESKMWHLKKTKQLVYTHTYKNHIEVLVLTFWLPQLAELLYDNSL